jgi:NTE family protein
MKKALVLSGGGSKGAYQIGVWKALRKLNINVDIVTGTSIGALNGCLIVQNDFEKALNLWNNLSFSNVFKEELKIGKEIEVYQKYAEEFIKNGGMNTSALEDTIKKNINTDKFYQSKTDFGLVTFKVNELKPLLLTKKDIKEHLLGDYLVASATCFPAFKLKKIDDDFFIDGGYYDNLPINLAVKMGATDIIAVDLKEIGFKKISNKKIKNIIYIKPRNKLKSFLYFDRDEAKRQIKLGYNDTLKTYRKLEGNLYSFSKIYFVLNEFLYLKRFSKNFENKSKVTTKLGKAIKYIHYHDLDEDPKKIFIVAIEKMMTSIELKEETIWNIIQVNNIIKSNLNNVDSLSIKTIQRILKNKEKINEMIIIKTIYELMKTDDQKKLNIISLVNKDLFLAAVYLYTIKKEN